MGLPDYEKNRLLICADSFRQLAKSVDRKKEGESKQREAVLKSRYVQENRQVISDNLKEVAGIVTRIATDRRERKPVEDRKARNIIHALKDESIRVKDLFYLKGDEEREELGVEMYTTKKGGYASEDVADMLSVLLNKRLQVSDLSPAMVKEKPEDYIFREEPEYLVMTGVARAIQENETCSGDNYSFLEIEQGRFTVLLSDGTGSGEEACADSEQVLDLMEKMLEAGFDTDAAINMVNGMLVASGEEHNMSTLDVCDLNLYDATCEFRKVGGAASFVKRDHMIEEISSRTLPLGVFCKMDTEIIKCQLMDGDYVVMVTDGVLDALGENQYEEAMKQYLSGIHEKNPGAIADRLLQFVLYSAKGRIRDDMTILVLGIWENT